MAFVREQPQVFLEDDEGSRRGEITHLSTVFEGGRYFLEIRGEWNGARWSGRYPMGADWALVRVPEGQKIAFEPKGGGDAGDGAAG